jgi:hypothetical protein
VFKRIEGGQARDEGIESHGEICTEFEEYDAAGKSGGDWAKDQLNDY